MFKSIRNTLKYLVSGKSLKESVGLTFLFFAGTSIALLLASAAMYWTGGRVESSIHDTLEHLPKQLTCLPQPVVHFYAYEQAGDVIIHNQDDGPVVIIEDMVLRFGFKKRRSSRPYGGDEAKFWSEDDIVAEIETVNPFKFMGIGAKPPMVKVTLQDIPSQFLHQEVRVGMSRYTDGFVNIINSLDDYDWSETQRREEILLYPVTGSEEQLLRDAFPRSIDWAEGMRRKALNALIWASLFLFVTFLGLSEVHKAAQHWYRQKG
jgi:hypothetical protein